MVRYGTASLEALNVRIKNYVYKIITIFNNFGQNIA